MKIFTALLICVGRVFFNGGQNCTARWLNLKEKKKREKSCCCLCCC